MNLKPNTLLFSSSLAIALVACGGEEKKTENTEPAQVIDTTEVLNNKTEEINEATDFKFHVFIANIPSPLETMMSVSNAGLAGDKTLVNAVENAEKYSTLSKKALNYGVYGTDMSYLAVYDMTQEVTDYYATVKSLAEELGAVQQFDKVMTERFQANLDNNDSLIILMDNALGATDDYLKNNQRMELACLSMTGSWVEAQYIMTKAMLAPGIKGDMTKLNQTMVAQKNHLKSLIDLLGEQKNNDCKTYKAELTALQGTYDKIVNPEDATEANLKAVLAKIKRLRDKITR